MENYAFDILEKERQLLESCLSKWELENYPEARKNRNDKLKNISQAIEKLKSNSKLSILKMTPKEKAKNLVEFYCLLVLKSSCKCSGYFTLTLEQAKEFALINIDNILEEIKDSVNEEILVSSIIYYQKVKTEIKLYETC